MLLESCVNSGSETSFVKLKAQYGSAELPTGVLVGDDGFGAE